MSHTVFAQDPTFIISGQERKQKFISVSDETYFAVLPVLDVQINQQTDLSISKTLKGSFNYVVFQDMPVSLVITGIYSLGRTCSLKGTITKKAIQDLYTTYKIGNPSNKALSVTVNGIRYDVMAISLTQKSSGLAQGVMAYVLSMVGSRVG